VGPYNALALPKTLGAVLFLLAAFGCQERSYPLETYRDRPDAGNDETRIDAPPSSVLPDVGRPPENCRPQPETCNGRDDDCNGKVDDVPRVDLESNVLQCGSCDVTCLPVPPNADSYCEAGQCKYRCKEGFIDVNMSKEDGCECQFSGAEICDGKDNNCNGKVDEDFDLSRDPENCGACGKKCSIPGAEAACENGMCVLKACLPGLFDRNGNPMDGCESTCAGSNGGVEICDGVDNDCDGKVDELVSASDRTTDDKLVYIPAPLDVTIFAFEASRPDATDRDPGRNSSVRPCSVPGRLPWANVTKEEARDACRAIGGAWRLCTKEEWLAACSSRGMNAYPYGARYDGMRCNGVDFRPTNPDVVPTGSAALCVAAWGPSADDQIKDMSGNVREWVLTGDNFEMRGGAYNVASFDGDAPGLKCTGVVPAPTAPVRLPSVGFRCCHPGRLP
jgi:hypothetical protein